MENISRRAALSTTGRAAVAVLAGGGLSFAATDPNVDEALFRKEAELLAAIARKEELLATSRRLGDEVAKLLPPRPACPYDQDKSERMPADAFAAFGEIKAKDIGKTDRLPADNPYRVWERESKAKREATQATWDAWGEQSERLYEESGSTAADHEWEAQLDRVQELAHELLEIPAKSLAGIMVKLRLQDDPFDYNEGMVEILQSIDDDLRAMAGEPPIERDGEEEEEA